MFSASTLISALQLVSYAKVARLMNPDIPPGNQSSTLRVILRPIKKNDFGTNVKGKISEVFQNCTNVYPFR